jgi:hypothetical protein
MRWFRFGRAHPPAAPEPTALINEVRTRFGAHVPGAFAQQATAATQLLDGDEGLAAAAAILRQFTGEAHADLTAQAGDLYRRTGHRLAVDRSNYRPAWQAAGKYLHWNMFTLPSRLQPYVHVAAAATALGAQAKRLTRTADPRPPLSYVLETFDLLTVGWEFGRVRVDTDGVTLARQLIATTRGLHDAISSPPPLPAPIRELMRRNNTIDVVDPDSGRVAGAFNPGKTLREVLLT